jgi:hypothetical protein
MTPHKIVCHYIYPPIPVRSCDWEAHYDDYDADCDGEGFFSHDPIGRGATEAAAVLDLIENYPRPDVFCAERTSR